VFCFVQFVLIMTQTFLVRYAQNVGPSEVCEGIFGAIQDSSKPCSVLYPFTYSYSPANNTQTGFLFFYTSRSCNYDRIRTSSCSLFGSCTNSSCPPRLFTNSFHASQAIVALGVITAALHIAPLAVVMITYACFGCCSGAVPGKRMLMATIFIVFLCIWFQIGQLIASTNLRAEFEEYNGLKPDVRSGFILNIVTLSIDGSLFVLLLIYLICGGREKVYCSCDDYKPHDDTTNVVVVTPALAPANHIPMVAHAQQQPMMMPGAPIFVAQQGPQQPQVYLVQQPQCAQGPYVQM
jgi:hypothetical protein